MQAAQSAASQVTLWGSCVAVTMSAIASLPPARSTRCFGEDLRLVGREIDHAIGDDDVGRLTLERQMLDVGLDELDVGDAVVIRESGRLVELSLGHVDADDAPGRPRLARCEETVHAGAAAEVDDRLAGLDRSEVEVVADAGEGIDRRSWYRVELGDGVAESDRELTAGLEMELLVRLFGDLAIHLLHALLELLCVECCLRRTHLGPPWRTGPLTLTRASQVFK
jgi:hypothetical protein